MGFRPAATWPKRAVGTWDTDPASGGGGGGTTVNVSLNGLVKDYNPPGGIDPVGTINFQPLSQDWASGKTFAAPQGFFGADTWSSATAHLLGSPSDSGWPNNGVNRGNFVGGTAYNQYDIVTDTGDGLVYVCKPNAGTSNPTAPHLNLSQWALITWNGFSPRSRDAGYYGSCRRTGDASRWFSTEIVGRATSGNVEPSFAAGTNGLDGGVYWARTAAGTQRGPWAASTAYSIGDYIKEDGSYFRCTSPGTSDVAEPLWTISGPNYGSTVPDGPDILWQRRYVDAGAWASLTKYGARCVSGLTLGNPGTDVRFQAVTHSDGSTMLLVAALTPTDGITGSSEPAWSAAVANQAYEDYAGSGNLIWRFGTFAVINPGTQNERLVLTGLATPSSVGKTLTITNAATPGTLIDVVLADKDVLDGVGTVNLTGTDKVSVKPFSFSGANIRLAEGQSQIVKYNGTNWVVGP